MSDGAAQTSSEKKSEQREEEEIYEKTAASAHIVFRAILDEGREELDRSTLALAWSGLAAGLSMGFSLVAEGLLASHLPDAPWRPLISKLGYSVGFLIVVLGRQQLFTENTLTPILPLLKEKRARALVNVLRLWMAVLITNLLGDLLFAWAFQRSSIFGPEIKGVLLTLGEQSVDANWSTIFLRAIVAGWLIALMVWLLPVAETARVSVIIIITYLIGLGHFSHVIAGSVDVLYAVFAGSVTAGTYVTHFLFPSLLGNIIGGVSLVAALNYAQVVSGVEEK